VNHYVVKETHDLKFHVTLEDTDPYVEWAFRHHNREIAEDFAAMLNIGAAARVVRRYSATSYEDGGGA